MGGIAHDWIVADRRAAREAAVKQVLRGHVLRVEAAAAADPGPRLAGYLVRPDTEQPLHGDVLRDLVALVQSPQGFDDAIEKRCKSGVSVGFRLARSPEQPSSEVVLDFGCDRLMVGAPGRDAGAQASYFDPSRPAFVDLAKRALPDDPEVQALER